MSTVKTRNDPHWDFYGMNRSEVWTQGICCDLHKSDTNYKKLRLFFFEMDKPILNVERDLINDTFRDYRIPFLSHRSGNGCHWIGIKLLSLETWKEAMSKLKHLNKKCPMTTLRWKQNKYVNETDLWYNHHIGNYLNDHGDLYSDQLSNLLNTTFGIENPYKFKGNFDTTLKFVNYRIKYDTK